MAGNRESATWGCRIEAGAGGALHIDRLPGTSKVLVSFGAMALVGHAVGVVADIYSGYSPNVAVELGSVISLSLENIGPLLQADALVGHYLAVFFIPLGIFGVWQVFVGLRPARGSMLFLVLGTLCVVYGTFYHGTLAFLTGAIQSSGSGDLELNAAESLVRYFNALSEPLGMVLLAGNLMVSTLFAFTVGFRRTQFPRWFAVVNPVVIQLVLSVLMVVAPVPIDQLLWLTVFNASFVLWYVATTLQLARLHTPDLG